MLKSPFARVCLAATLVIGLVASLSADHSWGSYHWARTENPAHLQVASNLTTAQWRAALGSENTPLSAISDWNLSSVLELTLVTGNGTRNCKPTAGRIEVCNAKYGNNGWLGIAQIWITGGDHITQAVTKVNDTYFNMPTYNTPDWRQFVMCQEVGHDFGLDHQDETFNNANYGSCMDYTNSPAGTNAATDNRHPNAHDYEELEEMYSHLDTTNTASAARLPAAMGQLPLDERTQWGQLVSQSANGRQEVYELDFGGGNKVVTHVFWADPDADATRGRSNR
jgi:hypothetical protein